MTSLRRFTLILLVWTSAASRGLGVDPLFQNSVVFSSGDGYPVYRIPAIISSSFGTLLAFAEGRPTTNDLGENDIVLKRSLDNGQSWQTMQVPLPHELANTPTRGFSNPTPVVDQSTGDIFLFASRPAINGALNYADIYFTKSSNDGVTWSAPTNISAAIRPDDDRYMLTGPGHALQMENGRLIIPIYSRAFNDNNESAMPHVIYSDDHGTSWQLGGEVPKPPIYPGQPRPISLVEPSIVETENGLYMNMRTRAYAPTELNTHRSYSFSTDGGMTWSTSEIDPTLIDANTQGSVARWTTAADDGMNRILLSNASSIVARENLSVRASYDEGLTWDNPRTIFFGRSSYSDMAASSDGTMNLLYENGRAGDPRFPSVSQYQQITLAQFNTQWLETPQIYSLRYDLAEQAPGAAVSTADAGIQDSDPWQLHAQAFGNSVYVTGSTQLEGTAVRLDGDGDFLLLRNSASQQFFDLTGADDFTIEAVLRTTAHGSGGLAGAGLIMGRGTLVSDASSVFAPHWYMQIVDGRLNLNLRDEDGVIADLTSDVLINDGEWHSLAAVRDAQSNLLQLIIDGKLAGQMLDPTGSFGGQLDASNTYVGIAVDGISNTRYLQADLDMVRFSRATPSSFQLVSIPEPSSMLLTLTVVGGLVGRRYRQRRAAALHGEKGKVG